MFDCEPWFKNVTLVTNALRSMEPHNGQLITTFDVMAAHERLLGGKVTTIDLTDIWYVLHTLVITGSYYGATRMVRITHHDMIAGVNYYKLSW